MTATSFAQLVQARPTGRRRWQARCPAHPDKSPSLAIAEGVDGRVLVRCWAGCALTSILAALRLTARDLFAEVAFDPKAAREAHLERLKRERLAATRAVTERRLADVHRRLGFAVDSLGERLARAPEGDETLTPVFHRGCDLLHIAETGFNL